MAPLLHILLFRPSLQKCQNRPIAIGVYGNSPPAGLVNGIRRILLVEGEDPPVSNPVYSNT